MGRVVVTEVRGHVWTEGPDAGWFSESDALDRSSDLSPEFPPGWSDDRMQGAYDAPWTEPTLVWGDRDGRGFTFRPEGTIGPGAGGDR